MLAARSATTTSRALPPTPSSPPDVGPADVTKLRVYSTVFPSCSCASRSTPGGRKRLPCGAKKPTLLLVTCHVPSIHGGTRSTACCSHGGVSRPVGASAVVAVRRAARSSPARAVSLIQLGGAAACAPMRPPPSSTARRPRLDSAGPRSSTRLWLLCASGWKGPSRRPAAPKCCGTCRLSPRRGCWLPGRGENARPPGQTNVAVVSASRGRAGVWQSGRAIRRCVRIYGCSSRGPYVLRVLLI
mmetsp:Transcript_28228/g.72546  ORF Transcript_28228/g.72546 Transcript_28228/m.72546 type:complete len:243 (+) Transcript_28228:623-1351(+)